MDQVIGALNELHLKATSAINAFQQGSSSGWPWRGPQQHQQQEQRRQQANRLQALGSSSSSSSNSAASSSRRVHFVPPFASLSPLGRGGGSKAGDSSSKKQKKDQDEEDERILISEVCSVACVSVCQGGRANQQQLCNMLVAHPCFDAIHTGKAVDSSSRLVGDERRRQTERTAECACVLLALEQATQQEVSQHLAYACCSTTANGTEALLACMQQHLPPFVHCSGAGAAVVCRLRLLV